MANLATAGPAVKRISRASRERSFPGYPDQSLRGLGIEVFDPATRKAGLMQAGLPRQLVDHGLEDAHQNPLRSVEKDHKFETDKKGTLADAWHPNTRNVQLNPTNSVVSVCIDVTTALGMGRVRASLYQAQVI